MVVVTLLLFSSVKLFKLVFFIIIQVVDLKVVNCFSYKPFLEISRVYSVLVEHCDCM